MSSVLIIAIAVLVPMFLIMGILVLLGKSDNILLGDLVVAHAILVAVFKFCE